MGQETVKVRVMRIHVPGGHRRRRRSNRSTRHSLHHSMSSMPIVSSRVQGTRESKLGLGHASSKSIWMTIKPSWCLSVNTGKRMTSLDVNAVNQVSGQLVLTTA